MLESRLLYLIVMRSSHEDDWASAGNVEGTSRSDFSEEDLSDKPPKDHDGLVGHRRTR